MTDRPSVVSIRRGETYKANLYCGNCTHTFTLALQKGTLVASVNWTCPNCGCTRDQMNAAYDQKVSSPFPSGGQ